MNKGFGRKPKNQKKENAGNSIKRTTPTGNRPGVEYRKVSDGSQGNVQSNPQRDIQRNAQNDGTVRKPAANTQGTRHNNTQSRSVHSQGRVPQLNSRKNSGSVQNLQNNHAIRNNAQSQAERRAELARQNALEVQRRRMLKKKRAQLLKNIVSQAAAVCAFSLIGMALCLAAIFLYLKHDFSKTVYPSSLPVEIVYGENEKDSYTLKSNEYSYSGGKYYISLPALSQKLGFSILGDVKKMTLSLSDTQNAVFDVGSTAVNINGSYVSLSEHTYFSDGALYIPSEFFTNYCSDTASQATKSSHGRVFRIAFPESLKFVCDTTKATPSVSAAALFAAAGVEEPEFTTDLSEYEKYMNPENPDEYLTLINTSHMLASDYIPDDLTEFIYTRNDRAKQKLRLAAAKSLEAMFKEMYAAGFDDVTVTSGYRSYDYQTTLFNNEIASLRSTYGDKAEQKAAEAVAIPGSSEHQSGLCADLHNLSAASVSFEKQDAYKWLYSHCADFGFILRFPKDKTDITGIMFEPWHYRFVGRYHAQRIMSTGLCLEEYMEQYNSSN